MNTRVIAHSIAAFLGLAAFNCIRAAEDIVSSKIWTFDAAGPIRSSPAIGSDPAAGSDSIAIYFGADDANGTLYALRPGATLTTSQRVKWSKPTGRPFGYSSPTIASDGTVLVATASLYAFAPLDGASRGQFQFPNGASAALNSSPAIGTNGDVYVGSSDGRFYALKRANNAFTVNWSIALGAPPNPATIASSPSVTADGTIYFVTDYDLLVALRPDGTRKWERALGGVYQPGEISSSPAIGRDGSIYVGSRNARVSALSDNGTSSSVLWEYVAPSLNLPPWFVSSPIAGFDGLIYASGTDGQLYALKPSGSTVAKKFIVPVRLPNRPGSFLRSTPGIDNLGTVWIGSLDNIMYGVDYSSGEILYAVQTGGQIHSSPVLAIDVDNKPVVYFGSSDSTFYALRGRADLGSRISAPWPMYRKDASHSGFGSATPPFITQMPASQTVQSGDPVVFTVVAGGNPALSYQWRRGDTPITGNPSALTATLSLGPASPNDNGAEYDVIVSNSQSSLTSSKAKLTVSNKPDILANNPTFTMLEDTTSTPIPFTVFDAETPANNLVVTGSSSDTRLLPNGNFFFGGADSSRTVALRPAANQFGTATITLFVQDRDGLQNSSTFTLTVTPVNDPPTLDPVADVLLSEGGLGTTVTVTGITPGQANELGQSLFLNAVSDNPGVRVDQVNYLSPNPTGSIRLLPVVGFNGVARITVTVTDSGFRANGGIDTFSRTFNASVTAINDPPTIAVPGARTISEDTTAAITGVQIADPDAGSGLVRVTLATANGIIGFGLPASVTFSNGVSQGSSVAMTGSVNNINMVLSTLAYSPRPDYSGPDTISLGVDDEGNTGQGGSKTATASIPITVTPANDAPRIFGVPPEVTILPTVSFLDFTLADPDTALDTISLSAASSRTDIVPTGNLTFSGSGASRRLRINPIALAQTGLVITLTANDGNPQNGMNSFGFLLRVLPVNSPPTLRDVSGALTILEDSFTRITFTVADTETAAASLGVTATSSNPALVPNLATNLALSLDPQSGGSGRVLLVTPATNQFGVTDITITVTDGTTPVAQTIRLNVTAVSDPPVLGVIQDVTVFTSGVPTQVPFTVFDGDTEPEALQYSLASSDQSIVVTGGFLFISGTGTNRALRVTPEAGKFGSTRLTLTATDPDNRSDSKSFQFTVQNPTPVIVTQPAPQTVALGGTATFTVVATGPGPISYQWSKDSIMLEGATASTLVLTNVQVAQEGRYSVVVSNAVGGATSAEATLEVEANTPPAISRVADQTTIENTPLAGISFSISDGETVPASLIVTANSSNHDLVPVANIVIPSGNGPFRTMTITPAPGKFGAVDITVTVTDGSLSTSTTFKLAIIKANTPPTITDLKDIVLVEGATTNLVFTVGDAETAVTSLVTTASSSNPALVPVTGLGVTGTSSFRTLRITPAAGQSGTGTIYLKVSDGLLETQDTFSVTVLKVNTPPTISDIADVTLVVGSTTNLVFNIGDAQSASANLAVTATSPNTTLLPPGALVVTGSSSFRTLRIMPAAVQSGVATITMKVSDGELEATDSFVLTVAGGNQAPVISELEDVAIPENTSINIPFRVSDAGNAPGSLVVGVTSTNPTLVPPEGLFLLGQDGDRILRIVPATGQSGVTAITLRASDGVLATTETFLLTVRRENTPPTLSVLADIRLSPNRSTNIQFQVSDQETPPAELKLTFQSSNPQLLPLASLSLIAGDHGERTLVVSPAANQTGASVITLSLSDNEVAVSRSFVLRVGSLNDAFLDGEVLAGLSVLVETTNADATRELGEPRHANKPGGSSLWWFWTAPVSGATSVSTSGSLVDTLLAVYTGTTLGELATVASNDDDPEGGSTSRLNFPAVEGTRYAIAVDAFGGQTGTIRLNLQAPEKTGPLLRAETSGRNVILSWPASATSYVLESSDGMPGPIWVALNQLPILADDQYSVKINAATGIRFFRLRRE